MKKILILGATGMLGNAVSKHFLANKNYKVVLTARNVELAYKHFPEATVVTFDPTRNSLESFSKDYDYVINCIGTIKPFMASNPRDARYINAVFPWEVASWASKNNIKVLTITSDCCWSGKQGKYTETSLHDALDDYGKSKSLGEPINDCMVIRTSIIGEEIHKDASLISWAKSQAGKQVKGYTHHYWNGITTNQYAIVCDKIITNDWYEKGLFHVYAKEDVNKLQMMHYFNKKFNLNLQIEAASPGEPVDRTLRTIKELNSKLQIPTVEEMITSL